MFDGGGIWNVLSFILLIIFFFFLPKLMVYQIISLLNSKVLEYEGYIANARKEIFRKIRKKTSLSKKQMEEKFGSILEFFVVEPSSIDPFGIAKKINFVTRMYDKKMLHLTKTLAPGLKEAEVKDVSASLTHTIGLYQIVKALKHYIQIIKETNNFQIGMIIQMQLPFLDKQVKALYKSIPAFIHKIPVGDSIAPLFASKLIGNGKCFEIAEDTVCCKKELYGKNCFIVKAKGPEANLGNIKEAVERLMKKYKIEKVITIDAAGGKESEKTGEVAYGVGFAMGDRGAERYLIEDLLMKKGIPIEAIAIKMKPEEALMPMKKEILDSIPKIEKYLEEILKSSKEKNILIYCAGITIGVGNAKKDFEKAVKKIKENLRREKRMERRKRISWIR